MCVCKLKEPYSSTSPSKPRSFLFPAPELLPPNPKASLNPRNPSQNQRAFFLPAPELPLQTLAFPLPNPELPLPNPRASPNPRAPPPNPRASFQPKCFLPTLVLPPNPRPPLLSRALFLLTLALPLPNLRASLSQSPQLHPANPKAPPNPRIPLPIQWLPPNPRASPPTQSFPLPTPELPPTNPRASQTFTYYYVYLSLHICPSLADIYISLAV